MAKICTLCIIILASYTVSGFLFDNLKSNLEFRRIDMIVDIIMLNLKKNGWNTILCFGNLPDEFYKKIQDTSYPFAITNIAREDENIKNVVRFHANTIVVNLEALIQYESTLLKLINSPYWHPHSNLILYYHEKDSGNLAKLFYSMWYYKIINAIILQYDDSQHVLLISYYSPYMTDDYKLDRLYGCWTTRKITMPITSLEKGLNCEEMCYNVSLHSKRRVNNLGTCVGFSTIAIPYNASRDLSMVNLFPDKAENLHGFVFRSYATEIQPFLLIDINKNGSFTLRNKDGLVWNTLAKLMNFKIDLTPSFNDLKKQFNFELAIQQIFDVSHRKADFFLMPVYLIDLIIIKIDNTFPIKDSGVCILSHRSGFNITLFHAKSLDINKYVIAQFLVCFVCIWILISIYQRIEKRNLTFDQIGKDLMNAFRNVLMMSLYKPPRGRTFRIFITISLWGFFAINFASQAIIISIITAVKRGKEVDTFKDIIHKGYPLYGMASPDIILPNTEERFVTINSRLIPHIDLFECVKNMTHDKNRFCLIDCTVARFLERNKLNEHGEQYLHVARQDRMHSHYLTLLLSQDSPLTEQFNKFIVTFFEAGLIKKWEQYRYAAIKEETPTRPLGMDDFKNVFNIYCFSVAFISLYFIIEFCIFHIKRFLCNLSRKSRVDGRRN